MSSSVEPNTDPRTAPHSDWLLHHIRCGVVWLNADLSVEAMNPEAERTYIIDQADALGRNFLELFVPPASREIVSRGLELGWDDEGGEWREGTFVTPAGHDRHLLWRAVNAADPQRLVLISQNVTALRTAERQVRELEDAARERHRLAELGAIAAKVVHDLAGPLTVIIALSQRLLRGVERSSNPRIESLQPDLGDIHVAAGRMRSMLRGCLEVTRRQRLQLLDIDLNGLLQEVASSWRAETQRRDITIDVDVHGDATLRADRDKLRRVLDNLVQNALEAIGPGPGRIDLQGIGDSHGVIIRVGDTGPGVPDGVDLYGLFETTKENGTGLGLAIAKEFVLEHGGSIHHAPRKPHGVVFTIELIAKEPPAGAA